MKLDKLIRNNGCNYLINIRGKYKNHSWRHDPCLRKSTTIMVRLYGMLGIWLGALCFINTISISKNSRTDVFKRDKRYKLPFS